MSYVVVMLLGIIGGAVSVYVPFAIRRAAVQARSIEVRNQLQDLEEQRTTHVEVERRWREERDETEKRLHAERKEFEKRVVSYSELQDENTILKRDLQNVDVSLRKLEIDRDIQREVQENLDRRATLLGGKFMKDNVKWITGSLTPNNFVNCKKRLLDVISWCREIGFSVSEAEEEALVADLKGQFERIVRAAFEREEQARIKAQIREEQKLQKEIEREIQQVDRERAAIQAALEKALAEARDEHSAQVEELRARLADAEARGERATARAQMTRAGYVYVISNVGSFGDGVLKIGMTRRLEPMDRVKELGDASVPFPFDVHMMVSSDDAPTLENALHRALHKVRLNKMNPRKEFFRANVDEILAIVKDSHGEVEYVADAEALEFRQSLEVSDEDQEYIEHVFEDLSDEDSAGVSEA